MAPLTSFNESWRRARSPTSTVASSSAVASRTVAKRQCSTSSSSRNMPRWVWVLPTSTASSMPARSKHADPPDALTLEGRERVVEREAPVELEQRNQDEAAGGNAATPEGEAPRLPLEDSEQHTDYVDTP